MFVLNLCTNFGLASDVELQWDETEVVGCATVAGLSAIAPPSDVMLITAALAPETFRMIEKKKIKLMVQ